MKKIILLIGLILVGQSSVAQEKSDQEGWSVKFHFGFSRINYQPTDIHIKSSHFTGQIDRADFDERTSAHWYNPFEKGRKVEEYFKWIDEPSNAMSLSAENKNWAFYLTALHPKYRKSFLYKENDQGGYDFADIGESDDFSQSIPEGYTMGYIGATHKRMDWSLGVGRKILLFKEGRFNVKYIPRVELGISTGVTRSVRIVPGEAWDDYYDKAGLVGKLASVGHRIEIERGRLSLFIDQKLVYSEQSHEMFGDGEAEYKLIYIPTSFGVSYSILERPKRK